MGILALLAIVAFITGNRIIGILLLLRLFGILTHEDREEKRMDKIIKEGDAIVERCRKKRAQSN